MMNITDVTDGIKRQIIPEYLMGHHGNNHVKKVKILFQDRPAEFSLLCIAVNSKGVRLTRSALDTIFSQSV